MKLQDRGCLPAIALAQARRAGKPLPQDNPFLLSFVFCPLTSLTNFLIDLDCPLKLRLEYRVKVR